MPGEKLILLSAGEPLDGCSDPRLLVPMLLVMMTNRLLDAPPSRTASGSLQAPLTAEDYDWLRDPVRADWFWSRMLIGTDPTFDHWLWIGDEGARMPSGHNRLWYHGTSWLMHRFAYVLAGGSLEDGDLIRHRCFNDLGDPRPDCGSIHHLSAGSALDNARDRD